jgi:hypothetical protein
MDRRRRNQRGGTDLVRHPRARQCRARGIDVRAAAGRPRLGAVNAALYEAARGASPFRDITQGDNSYGGVTGYQATKGWDPTTGLGSADTGALVKKLLA